MAHPCVESRYSLAFILLCSLSEDTYVVSVLSETPIGPRLHMMKFASTLIYSWSNRIAVNGVLYAGSLMFRVFFVHMQPERQQCISHAAHGSACRTWTMYSPCGPGLFEL